MFEHALDSSWEIRSRRGITTLTSIALQVLAVAGLLMFSLLRPTGLPSFHQISTPISLGQPMEAPPAPATSSSPHRNVPNINIAADIDIPFRPPSRIPRGIQGEGEDRPPQIGDAGAAIPGTGGGNPNGIANLFGSGSRPILPAVLAARTVAPLRISHMSEGNLIRRVQPGYPALAGSARVQGTVVLQAVISKDGSIENLRLISGHPMLAPAAIKAVQQWRYRPYILNNEPVEVETQITVNFSLAGN
jgi:protein TonB